MSWKEEYKKKLCKAEDIAAMVKPGDRINLVGGINYPDEFCKALHKRINELDDILIGVALSINTYDFMKPEFNKGQFKIETTFVGPGDRNMIKWGTGQYVPIHLHQVGAYCRSRNFNKIGFVTTLPDENGYVNRTAFAPLVTNEAIKNADMVFAEVNPNAYWLNSDDFKIHISEIDHIIETDYPLLTLPPIPVTDIEQKIGEYVADMIPNGSTVQVGFGGLADAVANLLKTKKDLSLYAETYTTSMSELCKLGVVNGANNPLIPGIALASFAVGSKEMYQYVDKNKDLLFCELGYLNDPVNIAKNKNLVGINGTLCVDLTGQACSESLGFTQISGTGGQADFARGISRSANLNSENSKFILAFDSVHTSKDGVRTSKIDITLPPGSVVTTTRTDVDYIVTEYGVAHLRMKNLSQRAQALINIAHPDFRDELKSKAKKVHLI